MIFFLYFFGYLVFYNLKGFSNNFINKKVPYILNNLLLYTVKQSFFMVEQIYLTQKLYLIAE